MSKYIPPRYDKVFREGMAQLDALLDYEPEDALSPSDRMESDQPGPSAEAYALAASSPSPAELQKLIDERDGWRRAAESQNRQWSRKCEQATELEARAEAAEADAALAWRRVTELQARGTELVLERRAADIRLSECTREMRDTLETYDVGDRLGHDPVLAELRVLVDKYEARS